MLSSIAPYETWVYGPPARLLSITSILVPTWATVPDRGSPRSARRTPTIRSSRRPHREAGRESCGSERGHSRGTLSPLRNGDLRREGRGVRGGEHGDHRAQESPGPAAVHPARHFVHGQRGYEAGPLVTEEVERVDSQSFCDPLDRLQGEIPLATLDAAIVGAVNANRGCERLLAEVAGLTESTELSAHRPLQVPFHNQRRCPLRYL